MTLPERLYDEPERIHAFARGVLDRIQYLPGVRSASLINMTPFGTMFISGDFGIEGQPKPKLYVGKPKIGAGYFKTMGIPLLAGREFTPQDTAEAPKVAIVSERVVREYFPRGPGEALGRRVRLSERGDWLTIVGVVADVRQSGLDQEPEAMLYVPFQQERAAFFLQFVSFVVRTATPASVVEGVRAEIRRAAPDLPIESTVTMDEAVAASVAQPRFRMLLLALFAIAATLIATCGIYGLMAYAVTQRRREIGVRMALGAEGRDVLRLVLGRALRVVAAGVMLGLAGAFAVTRVLQTFLFGVTPTDPIAFTVVTLRADRDRHDRGMAAGAARDQNRSGRGPARGIARRADTPHPGLVVGVRLVLRHVGIGDPRRDAFPRPVMRVVQVDDQRAERKFLLAAFGTDADDAFEAFEQAIEALGTDAVGRVGQAVDALVGRAERARAVAAAIVVAERLIGAPLGALENRAGQLTFVFSQVVHHGTTLLRAVVQPDTGARAFQDPIQT